MKPSSSDRLASILFVLSLFILAMVYGVFAAWRNWFPAPQIGLAYGTLVDLSRNWKNDFGLEPTRHLVTSGGAGNGLAREGAGQLSQKGYVLIAGLNDRQEESFHAVRLIDSSGREVYRWPIHYDRLDPAIKPANVMLHGMEVFEDGSLILTFDAGNVISRVDACGQPVWVREGEFHHAVTRDGRGRIVTLLGDGIAWLDAETGELLHQLEIVNDMTTVDSGFQRAMLEIRTRTPENDGQALDYLPDPFHINDAEPLRPDMAAAFTGW